MSELKIDKLLFSEVDSDGHIKVELPVLHADMYEDEVYEWIGREDAIRIIEHLKENFKI